MKKHIFIFIICFITSPRCFSQVGKGVEVYNWDELESVKIQRDGFDKSENELIDVLINNSKLENCGNIDKWKSAFHTLKFGPNKDVALEKTYIIVCEFANGLKIPFRYFPNQYSIYDMRMNYGNYYSFPEQNNRMRNAIKDCIFQLENND